MTKATNAVIVLTQLVVLYAILYIGLVPTPKIFRDEILPIIPFWALISFGCYALGTLGYDVLTFNDKPEKHQELLQVSLRGYFP